MCVQQTQVSLGNHSFGQSITSETVMNLLQRNDRKKSQVTHRVSGEVAFA